MNNNKDLLIISVYAPSENNDFWYKMQNQFTKEMTHIDFDYRIVTNGITTDIFESQHILHSFGENEQHSRALYWLLDYARNHRYKNYLFLDSDCFPIHKNWFETLISQTDQFDRKIAAPYRTENLDVFPHPCAMFIRGDFINDERINFDKFTKMRNLLNVEINDVGVGMSDLTELILPLLRTNVVSPHPIACAIYHHLFYHHGAGSRGFRFRVNRKNYTRHWYNVDMQIEHGKYLYNELTKNPKKFISRLSGHGEELIEPYLSQPVSLGFLQRCLDRMMRN